MDGQIGSATIKHIDQDSVEMRVTLERNPPPPLPITLIIALPRPKMIKRIIQTAVTMGVKKIIFLNSYRVEKSYWQTPLLTQERLLEHCILGLEQGVDTLLPQITLEKRFKPFVEDRLPALCLDKLAIVAHPNTNNPCPIDVKAECVLAIGPEGGFIDYEIEKLQQAGCQVGHLGHRILRTETAVPVLLSRLFPA